MSGTRPVALITGASRGIGLAIAREFVGNGYRVCLTGRTESSLAEAVAELGGPDQAMAVSGKADDVEHQCRAVARTLETFERLDVLVNNAGINPAYGPCVSLDIAAARKTLEVNVLGALSWTQQVHRAWLADHGGVVVNVASAAGLQAADGLGIYGASKAALIALTRQLAYELGPRIRVNAVAPAVVKTDFARALYEGKEADVVATYPAGRLGCPEDIAHAVHFLASSQTEWVTGQTLVLDGGLMLGGRL